MPLDPNAPIREVSKVSSRIFDDHPADWHKFIVAVVSAADGALDMVTGSLPAVVVRDRMTQGCAPSDIARLLELTEPLSDEVFGECLGLVAALAGTEVPDAPHVFVCVVEEADGEVRHTLRLWREDGFPFDSLDDVELVFPA